MPRDLDLALIGPFGLAFRRRAPRAIVIAAIALAAFALVLVIDGKDPVRAYRDTLLYVFGNAYGFSELLVRMTPSPDDVARGGAPQPRRTHQCRRRGAIVYGRLARDCRRVELPGIFPPGCCCR